MLATLAAVFGLVGTQSISVRTGKIDITPPVPLALGGYTERRGALFEPSGDPLFARTLFLEGNGTRFAVVSVEMLTVPESLYREISRRIPHDIKLFLAATHTHCAPDSQMLNDRMTIPVPGIARYDKKWLDWYAERVVSGLRGAMESPSSDIKSFTYRTTHLALNRPRRLGGSPDSAVFRLQRKAQTLITHYAAHPVFYGPTERLLRGDWPGRVADEGLVLQGAIGDVSPVIPEGASPDAGIESFSRQLEGSLNKAEPLKLQADPMNWTEVPIELEQPSPHPEFAKRYGVNDAFAKSLVHSFAPPKASISAFRIGKLAVIGVPGEPTGALGKRIRDAGRRRGFEVCLTVSHVNGWIGYILAPDDYDRGGYEATLSFHGRDTGERVYEAAERAINNLSRVAKRGT